MTRATVQLRKRSKTKPGRWYAYYRINGKQYNPFTGLTEETASKEEALEVADELYRVDFKASRGEINKAGIKRAMERAMESHGYQTAPKWDEFSQQFLALKKGKAVYDNYERIVRYFNEYLNLINKPSSLDVDGINEADITGFLAWLKKTKNHTQNSLNYALSVLRMIFLMAHEDGVIQRNPAKRIETKVLLDKTGKRPFTEKEIQDMLAVADEEWKTAILIGQWTGARLGDAKSMKGEYFHLKGKVPYVSFVPSKTSRTGKAVEIPLFKPLLERVKTLPRKGFLTPRLHDSYEKFEKIIIAAGVERVNLRPESSRPYYDVGFHSFRHTFNAWLKKNNVADWLRMEIIGWSSNEQKKYGKLTVEERAKMLNL